MADERIMKVIDVNGNLRTLSFDCSSNARLAHESH